MKEKQNYHSRLLGLSQVFDQVFEEIKNSYQDEKYSNWILWLLFAPFRDLMKVGEKGLEIKKTLIDEGTLLAIFPFLSMTATPFLTIFEEIPQWKAAFLGLGIGYLFTLIVYFRKLITFKSGHFHTGAYRRFRKQEYELFKVAVLDEKKDFFFKGLYDYIGVMEVGTHQFDELYSKIEQRLERHLLVEKHQLETKVSILKDQLKREDRKFKKAEELHDQFILSLINQTSELAEGLEIIQDLIKDVNTLLFRMKNRLFTTKDLSIVSGFTIYELRDSYLKKIEDVGTSGSSPDILPLKSKEGWSAVQAIKHKGDNLLVNTPYKNHKIISFKMKMGIDTGKVWVYNFHFDTTNKRALHLLEKNDIIDSREILRLIHAMCLLADRNDLMDKEDMK